MSRKSLYILGIILAICFETSGQDVHFSQFYASPLYLSPSYSGAAGSSRVTANYRDQWPALPGTFITYAISWDHYFPAFNSGFGVQIMQDRAGSGNLSNTTVGLSYSYDFQINRLWHFRPGISFSYLQRGIDFGKLLFGSDIEHPTQGGTTGMTPLETIHNVDGSASALAYSDKIWAGFTTDHLLKPDVSFMGDKVKLDMKYSVFAGYRHELLGYTRKYVKEFITAAFNFRSQGDFNQLDIGGYYERRPIIFGVWYRGIPILKEFNSNDAIAVIAGYGSNRIRIIYSYDLTISKLVSHTKGAHEISLTYLFNIKSRHKIKSPPCPHHWVN